MRPHATRNLSWLALREGKAMKHALMLMSLAAIACVAAMPDAPTAPTTLPADGWTGYRHGVIGGPHDFTSVTGRVGSGCSACHVPHVQAMRPLTANQPSTQPAVEMFRIGGQ